MTATVLECVVDASVAIKIFITEAFSDTAHKLFAQLSGSPPARFYVPDLFYVECTNILWKQVRKSSYPANDAEKDVEALRACNPHHPYRAPH